ncbi:MAG: hypothetical protein E6X17_13980 [Sporomusaceae bacterium]|nr:hypothetical protein [Sporomusaceae bacterium]
MKSAHNKLLTLLLAGLLTLPALAGANAKPAAPQTGAVPAASQAEATAPAADAGYSVTRSSYQTDQMQIAYPQLNIGSMLTEVLINYQLIQAPGNYKAALKPEAKLSIDYSVVRQDAAVFSVVFRGEQVEAEQSQPILTAVTYHLQDRVPLTAARLIENSDTARQGVNRLLQQAAAALPAASQPPEFSGQLEYYLTGQQAVFFYQPETGGDFIELPLPLDRLRPYLAAAYRELPAVAELNDPQQRVAAIDQALSSYRRVSGSRGGDQPAEFTAYFDGDALVYAEEKQANGEYSDAIARYYFAAGELIAYHSSSQELIIPDGGIASVRREEVKLQHDIALNRSAGERSRDGAAEKLTAAEIAAIGTAAKDLQTSAATLVTTKDH